MDSYRKIIIPKYIRNIYKDCLLIGHKISLNRLQRADVNSHFSDFNFLSCEGFGIAKTTLNKNKIEGFNTSRFQNLPQSDSNQHISKY